MEYRLIVGKIKKGQLYTLENNKINKNLTMEDEINRYLSKGWKLYGSPGITSCYTEIFVIYHLVKD